MKRVIIAILALGIMAPVAAQASLLTSAASISGSSKSYKTHGQENSTYRNTNFTKRAVLKKRTKFKNTMAPKRTKNVKTLINHIKR